jgi:hypothetical protein
VAVESLVVAAVELHTIGQGQGVDRGFEPVERRAAMKKANKELLITAGFLQSQCPVEQTALDAP